MIARYFLFFIIICLTTSSNWLHCATVGLGHWAAGLPDCGPILYLLLSYTGYCVHTTYNIQRAERSLGTYF